jgi:hypothetical protein
MRVYVWKLFSWNESVSLVHHLVLSLHTVYMWYMLNVAFCVSYVVMYSYNVSEKSVFSSTNAELNVKYGKY